MIFRFLPHALCGVLLPIALAGFSAPARAQTAPVAQASPAQISKTLFQFENRQRKVTVKDALGDTVWGGLIETPNVVLAMELKEQKIRFALTDESGKRLWEKTEDVGPGGSFEFRAAQSEKKGAEGVTVGVTSRPGSALGEAKKSEMNGLVILGGDNILTKGDFTHDGDERLLMLRRGDDMVITNYKGAKKVSEDVVRVTLGANDAKTSINGQAATVKGEGSVQLKDASGVVTARTVKRDGKDYIELILGDRRVLIEGGLFSAVVVDGVLRLSVAPASSAPANK